MSALSGIMPPAGTASENRSFVTAARSRWASAQLSEPDCSVIVPNRAFATIRSPAIAERQQLHSREVGPLVYHNEDRPPWLCRRIGPCLVNEVLPQMAHRGRGSDQRRRACTEHLSVGVVGGPGT